MNRRPMPRKRAILSGFWRALLFPGLLMGSACGVDEADLGAARPIAGPGGSGSSDTGRIWVETFDHRDQMRTVEGSAEVDSNRGRLTLPSEPTPSLESSGRVELGGSDGDSGFFGAEELVLDVSRGIEAPDALELRAARRIEIAGTLRVGEGGLLIAAGDEIRISGQVETSGPIELVITNPEGQIHIDGSVVAAGSPYQTSPVRIVVRGRGSLRLNGRLAVLDPGATAEQRPSVAVDIYGDVQIQGSTARIEAPAAGETSIETTGRVAIGPGTRLIDASAWSIGADRVELGSDAALELGSLSIVAENAFQMGPNAEIRAQGAELAIVSRSASLADSARLLGVGDVGTSIRLEASSQLEAGEGALVESVHPACDRSGQVLVRVGGPYVGSGRARFRSAEVAPNCVGTEPSGVLIVAHRFEGTLPDLGNNAGPFGGQQVDPELRVTVPVTSARVTGRWVSQPIPAARDSVPNLVELDSTVPSGASVQVALGVTDGPFGTGESFLPYDGDRESWSPHAGARWFVVRVDLEGRRFDVPAVDHIVVRW